VAGQKDILLIAEGEGTCLSLDSSGNQRQKKGPRRGGEAWGAVSGTKWVPGRLCRAEWGVQAIYVGLNLHSEARAFLASDGAENPIGFFVASSLHHWKALELARATARPTVCVQFSILLHNLL